MTIPVRPQFIPEQLRDKMAQQLGDQPVRFNREQTLLFLGMLAVNLEVLLNDEQRLPLVKARIDKHADGFALHVELITPSDPDIEL